MKYLVLSSCSLEIFIVPRLNKIKEVEKIYYWNMDTHYKTTGKGMENYKGWEKFELVTEYAKVLNEVPKNELTIIIGDVGLGSTGTYLRSLGYKVFGGSEWTDKIEEERQYATDLMSRIMDIPETEVFDSFDAGLQFLKAQEKDTELVFKPNDSECSKEYTYKAKNIADMVGFIQDIRPDWKWKESFQLQRVVKGVEVDCSAYFNGKEFIENSLILYFENKPFMDRDVGPATGGSIAVEFAHKPEGIFWEILNKLKPALIKCGYRGQLSINSIVCENCKKPHFLEFCGRWGWPSLPMDITLVEDNGHTLHELIQACVNGVNASNLFPTNKISCTVSIFVPPAPTAEPSVMSVTKGWPISWDKKWDTYFFPFYIMYDKKKGMVLAGINTWVAQCTCADATLDGALSMMYDIYMPTLKLKMAMYRSDCGISAKKRIKSLRNWKLL